MSSTKIRNIYNDITWKYENVKCYSKDFQKYEKLKLDIDFLNNFVCIRNSWSFNCPMFLMKTLYQFVKDSFVSPSIIVIKNSNIFQKNSVNPKTFYSSMVKWGCQDNFAPVYWLIDWFLRKVFKDKKQSQANINQQKKIKQTLNNNDKNFLRAETSKRVKVACFAFWCFFFAQNHFVKKNKKTIDRLEIVLIASFYYTTNLTILYYH